MYCKTESLASTGITGAVFLCNYKVNFCVNFFDDIIPIRVSFLSINGVSYCREIFMSIGLQKDAQCWDFTKLDCTSCAGQQPGFIY